MAALEEAILQAGPQPGLIRATFVRHNPYPPPLLDPTSEPRESAPPHEFSFVGSPSEFAHQKLGDLLGVWQHATPLRRVVIEGNVLAALRSFLAAPAPPAHPDIPILHRHKQDSIAPPAPLALPLTFGFSPHLPETKQNELLGLFVLDCMASGGARKGSIESASVGHVIVSPSQPSPRLFPSPRLMVIQALGPQGVEVAVNDALDGGAQAVLVVLGNESKFFQDFYRKILHNLPIEQCLIEAQRHQHLPVFLVAAEGGELSVMLTKAVADLATRPSRGGLESAMPGLQPASFSPLKAALGAPQQTDAFPPAARVRSKLTSVVNTLVSRLEADVRSLENLSFDDESHHAAETVRRYREVNAARPAVDQGTALAAGANSSQLQAHTARTTNVWLEHAGQRIPLENWLDTRSTYDLNVQVSPSQTSDGVVRVSFPEQALRQLLQGSPELAADVVLFAKPQDFELASPSRRLTIPMLGESEAIALPVKPLRVGLLPLRLGLYHRNRLLQSLRLLVRVGQQTSGPLLQATLDWAEDAALMEPEGQPPGLTIFTNDAGSGRHWVGIRDQRGKQQLAAYQDADLPSAAKRLRAALVECAGGDSYFYEEPFNPRDEARIEARARRLIKLACAGYSVFDTIFLKYNLTMALEEPTLISIARCVEDKASIPWAALYSEYIDTGRSDLQVCPQFLAQIRSNEWETQGQLVSLKTKKDLLDDPARCRAQQGCPLGDIDEAERTVCPFGFLGFRHRIEQPIQAILPVSPKDAQAPPQDTPPQGAETLELPTFPLTERIPISGNPKAQIAYDPGLAQGPTHANAITALLKDAGMTLSGTNSRRDVLASFIRGGSVLQYVFCHGEFQNDIYCLRLGPTDPDDYISTTNIRVKSLWSAPGLVVLNGCDAAGMTPDNIHDFVRKLRMLGAVGVVGTETYVYDLYAAPFGLELVRQMLNDKTLGEATLAARLQLLRELNPLGLVFTYYAPAGLHFHTDNCAVCARLAAQPAAPGGGAAGGAAGGATG